MIKLKTEAEIAILAEGGRRLARILDALKDLVRPGVTTAALDQAAYDRVVAGGDRPAFLHYRPSGVRTPYPASLCVSVNEEVVHGIPAPDRPLKEGDIVGLDLGLEHEGLYTDMAITVPVGAISPEAARLIEVTCDTLTGAIKLARPGHTLGDLGAYIEGEARRHGFGLVTELGGHGVGHKIHEEPQVPNEGKKGRGLKLEPGLVIAIEPMFTLGTGEVIFLPDEYTVITADGSPSAHFERTIAVTEGEPVVRPADNPLSSPLR
jgi:methionyl aminopeptidase